MENKREKWFRIFLIWWLLGFVWGAFIQLFIPETVAQNTVWGFSPGWQREIGGWNLGIIVIIICVLRSGVSVIKTLVPGLCVLFTFFGVHHLLSVLNNPGKHGYLIVILNFVPLIASALVFIFVGRREKIKKNEK
jgi:KinB signaling pathway activation protein